MIDHDIESRLKRLPTPPEPQSLRNRLMDDAIGGGSELRQNGQNRKFLGRHSGFGQRSRQGLVMACCLLLAVALVRFAIGRPSTSAGTRVAAPGSAQPIGGHSYELEFDLSQMARGTSPLYFAQSSIRIGTWPTSDVYLVAATTTPGAFSYVHIGRPQNTGNGSVTTSGSVGIPIGHETSPEWTAQALAIDTYLQQHGLSKVGNLVHVTQALQPNELLQGVLETSRSNPLSGWRLAVLKVQRNGGSRTGGYSVQWAKIVQPTVHDSLAEAVQFSLPTARHVQLLWQQTVDRYKFGLATFAQQGTTKVMLVYAERQPNGSWDLTNQTTNEPTSVTPQMRKVFNIYQMASGGGLGSTGQSGSYFVQSGLVLNPTIVKVRMTWPTGKQVIVPVVHGAFGLARTFGPNKSELESPDIVGLTAAGETVPMGVSSTAAMDAAAFEVISKNWRMVVYPTPRVSQAHHFEMELVYIGAKPIANGVTIDWGPYQSSGSGSGMTQPNSIVSELGDGYYPNGFSSFQPRISWYDINGKSRSETVHFTHSMYDVNISDAHQYHGQSEDWSVSYAYEKISGPGFQLPVHTETIITYAGRTLPSAMVSIRMTSGGATLFSTQGKMPIADNKTWRYTDDSNARYLQIGHNNAEVSITWKGHHLLFSLKPST